MQKYETFNCLTILALATLLFAPGCSQDQKPQPQALASAPAGGGDPSGGELRESGVTLVDQEIAKLKMNLRVLFYRLDFLQRGLDAGTHNTTTPSFVTAILKSDRESIWATLDRIQLAPINGDCYGDGELKAASMREDGTMCLSRTRLSKLTPESLANELIVLAAHEVGHARNLSEDQCRGLQNWLATKQILLTIDEREIHRKLINIVRKPIEALANLALAITDPNPNPELVCSQGQVLFLALASNTLDDQRDSLPVRRGYSLRKEFDDAQKTIYAIIRGSIVEACPFATKSISEKKEIANEVIQMAEEMVEFSRDYEDFMLPRFAFENLANSQEYLIYLAAAKARIAQMGQISATPTEPQRASCSLWNKTTEKLMEKIEGNGRMEHSFDTRSLTSIRDVEEILPNISILAVPSFYPALLNNLFIHINFGTRVPGTGLRQVGHSNGFYSTSITHSGINHDNTSKFRSAHGLLHPETVRKAEWDFQVADSFNRPLSPEVFSIRCQYE